MRKTKSVELHCCTINMSLVRTGEKHLNRTEVCVSGCVCETLDKERAMLTARCLSHKHFLKATLQWPYNLRQTDNSLPFTHHFITSDAKKNPILLLLSLNTESRLLLCAKNSHATHSQRSN